MATSLRTESNLSRPSKIDYAMECGIHLAHTFRRRSPTKNGMHEFDHRSFPE
jgi:hypothetical protein